MKSLVLACLLIIMGNTVGAQTLPALTVPELEGGTQALSAFNGKKILVVTLPLEPSASADSLLYSLDTLATAHSSLLKVIAVPSYEDGYNPSQSDSLLTWYRSKLGNHILITAGLYTRKTSGSQQHDLFKWLTDVAQNDVFNIDVAGPGYKFFCNSSGKLFAVFLPQSKMYGASVQKVLHAQ